MKPKIHRAHFAPEKRVIAISDIHGHLDHLLALLEQVNYRPGADILVLVGDYIARGPKSLATLRYLMELAREPEVYILSGNFEANYPKHFYDRTDADIAALFRHITIHRKGCQHSLFDDMFAELGLSVQTEADLAAAMPQVAGAFHAEIAFMENLPTLLETPEYIFVHGGIPTEDREELLQQELYSLLKNDFFLTQGHSFSRYVVVGHWPVCNYCEHYDCHNPIVDHERRIISIDGGMGVKSFGQLNAMILQDGTFSFSSWDSFPQRTAGEAQAESKEHIHIQFPDCAVTVLGQKDEFTYVEHHTTKARYWGLTEHLHYWDDSAHCVYSDYRPEVAAGDTVSLLRETTRGYLIKKHGIAGWYHGPLLPDTAAI